MTVILVDRLSWLSALMSKNKTKLHNCNKKRGTSPSYSPVGQPPVLQDVCYLQNSDNNCPFLRGNNSSNIYSLAPPSWVSPHTWATMLISRTTSRTTTLAPDLRYWAYIFSPMFPSARLSSGTVCTVSPCSDDNGVTHNFHNSILCEMTLHKWNISQ